MAAPRKFSPAKGLFVTGTDTGVGKTAVAGAIARNLSKKGYSTGVFKPIATGCIHQREGLISADAEFLAHCSNCSNPLEQINPVRYAPPLSPYAAVEHTGCAIDWKEMQLSYSNVIKSNDVVIVEGIGGLMVPLERHYHVLDLIVDMALDTIIVARAGLGTINHTLLSIDACRRRGIPILGIVINGYRGDKADLAEESNARIIQEVSNTTVLTVIPYDENTCVETGRLGQKISAAVDIVNWADQIGLNAKSR